MSCSHNVFCLSEVKEYTGIEISASYLSGLETETIGPQVQLISSLDVRIAVLVKVVRSKWFKRKYSCFLSGAKACGR